MTEPVSHLQEAQKLTADALVDLFQVSLKGKTTVFRFRDGPSVEWQNYNYEGLSCSLTGDSRSADGEEARPSLRVMNPLGIFNEAAMNGDLDLATVTRRRLLRQHLEGNVAISTSRMWYVGRVRELISGQLITLELRSMTEGANFQIPVRQFTPSEGFPFVTL